MAAAHLATTGYQLRALDRLVSARKLEPGHAVLRRLAGAASRHSPSTSFLSSQLRASARRRCAGRPTATWPWSREPPLVRSGYRGTADIVSTAAMASTPTDGAASTNTRAVVSATVLSFWSIAR